MVRVVCRAGRHDWTALVEDPTSLVVTLGCRRCAWTTPEVPLLMPARPVRMEDRAERELRLIAAAERIEAEVQAAREEARRSAMALVKAITLGDTALTDLLPEVTSQGMPAVAHLASLAARLVLELDPSGAVLARIAAEGELRAGGGS